MATHFNILAWEIPWTEEPGGLQSMGSKRVGHDLATKPTNNSVLGIVPNSSSQSRVLGTTGPLKPFQGVLKVKSVFRTIPNDIYLCILIFFMTVQYFSEST